MALQLQDGFDPVTQKFDTAILKAMYPDARYYFILGGRGWGKTYPTIRQSIDDAMSGKGVFAYVRRYDEELSGRNFQDLMPVHNQFIEQMSNGEWNSLYYWQNRWTLARMGWREHREADPTWERLRKDNQPIGGAWSLNTWERDKGGDFGADKGGVKNIIFDEVVSKGGKYLKDEWFSFKNVISTLVRERWEDDTKIWMLANPVAKYACPYFREMGITKDMLKEPGVREIEYPKDKFGNQMMSCVFCYLGDEKEETEEALKSNRNLTYSKFFAFPSSNSSVTHGVWELDDVAHLPSGVYRDSEEIFTTYFVMEDEVVGCKIMEYKTGVPYLFFYPAKEVPKETYYFTHFQDLSEYAIIGTKTNHPLAEKFNELWSMHHIYYADNTTGDMMHGWIEEANKITY